MLFTGGRNTNRRQPLRLLQLCELKQRQSAETCRSASMAGDQEPLKLQSDRNKKRIEIERNGQTNDTHKDGLNYKQCEPGIQSSIDVRFFNFALATILRFFRHLCHLVRGLSAPSREDWPYVSKMRVGAQRSTWHALGPLVTKLITENEKRRERLYSLLESPWKLVTS